MGKRSGNSATRGGGAAGVLNAADGNLGTVQVNGKKAALTGKERTVFETRDRAQIEIDISVNGFLGGRAFGSVVFNVDKQNNTARIVSINSIQQLKGQGVGDRLYGAAFNAAKARGVTTFNSDSRVSIPAANAWRRIGRKLGNVKENSSTNDGQQLIGAGGKPVFSLRLSDVTRSQLKKLQNGVDN